MKYCTNCGHPIQDENAKFCSNCAHPITVQPTEPVDNQNLQTPITIKKSIKFTKKQAVITAITAATLALIIACISILAQPHDATLKKCEKLIGAPVSRVVNNNTYSISHEQNEITHYVSKKTNIAGIEGHMYIPVRHDEEIIEYVVWRGESKTGFLLTEKERDDLITHLNGLYGEFDQGRCGEYVWHTKNCTLTLSFDSGAFIQFYDKYEY